MDLTMTEQRSIEEQAIQEGYRDCVKGIFAALVANAFANEKDAVERFRITVISARKSRAEALRVIRGD